MVGQFVAEGIVLGVSLRIGWLGRFKAHVVPAEILKAAADLAAEALGPHGWTRGALAGQQAGGERRQKAWVRFSSSYAPLLADHPAAEATN